MYNLLTLINYNLKGTGIGIYMSKIIIEDNVNGKLEVHSSQNGVLFIIKLGVNNEK